MPIPADTIVGMYHPFRDVVWKGFSAGVPFKNFLLTDAVRQQYPWRRLAVDLVKSGELPRWNPYTHAGTPLIANLQTAFFYPPNFLFLILPFNTAWTIQVMSQPILLVLFTATYLRNVGISMKAAAIASLALALSGFSIAWLEWNTTLHTLVWVPLALLAVDKVLKKGGLRWYVILGFSLASIFLAGFLQTAFYAFLLIVLYTLFALFSKGAGESSRKVVVPFVITALAVVLVTAVQWVPTVRLIAESARATDQGDVLGREDWFLPWQNLVQFVAPDFFGNPATLNYWGVFNYMEFVGYVGIIPFAFALTALFTSSRKKSFQEKFFVSALVLSLIFALPNPLSRIPYQLHLPLISTAQPSRMMMVIDLSLIILAAFGLDRFFRNLKESKDKKTDRTLPVVLGMIGAAIIGMWVFTFSRTGSVAENMNVARRNLILPTGLALVSVGVTSTPTLIKKLRIVNEEKFHAVVLLFVLLFFFTSADLLRFAWKFTPFSDADYLYPQTKIIRFLQSDTSLWRYVTTDARILPPNFSIPFRLQTLEGYDPIYIKRFGQLIAAAQKGEPTLGPTAFHRIIRPDNVASNIHDLMNVKYVLSLTDLTVPKLTKVLQEGETRVYLNTAAFPRAFLISDYTPPTSDLEAMKQVFALRKEEIQQTPTITRYSENEVQISVDSRTGGMLVLADTFYPGWSATLDGNPVSVERVLYTLRGTMIPSGSHEVFYRYSQL